MQAKIIDGKAIARDIKEELRVEVERLKANGTVPTLAVVLVGGDPASAVYVKNKKAACAHVGIRSLSYELPADTTEASLLELVEELNSRQDVHGILVQLPLPVQIDEDKVLMAIRPEKDVDGFHPMNVGNLSIGRPGFVSCTPAGILELLKRTGIQLKGKKCVIVGRSNIVGKPVAMLLLREHATVTICHSRTEDLPGECRQADVLVAAVGIPNFIKGSHVKPGAVVIDVGINRLADGKLCGDVDYVECLEVAGHITPVPGGVGPMTIAMLMKNCVEAASK
ncbi:bifunctional methylenetetrahydrofolate dehydrogenase/methenyltetrahydrofolate cyclohydrolase FolD [Anaerotalea alkaliphila]|uniref:Bifunctional protein FolD n=1 Tax=Anaerotalea alkaliphila TaxID=2662126 RepID=A0A7X5HTA7_9FIRM|nr:bifunctional methylenetetrahydrofolate dehydrogenase/methenyltetrahydrofolate cyclohydrolase FolD [Anaerotalea alkaliphila]NDL66275.1 bifunctional methylenetetrahydrofolate dehydrogenase/methenyltetrahydrofolate cyclohydrolase FolD [Anaerotalea alkaliphila]